MFSFFLIADIVNRDKNTYNILAASAFLILLYRPNMLAEVGFQLSYAAVFAIVTLYPYIYKWFTFKNKIANFFWSISAVSIAAQIGTLPISLYYFNQFPTTFLFANLIAIPAATIIFISGISILVFSFIVPPLAGFIGSFLEIIITTLHLGLSTLNKIPYSTIEFNSFTSYFPFIMILFFIGLIDWLLKQKRMALWLAAFSLLLLCFNQSSKKWDSLSKEKLLVYNYNKGLIVETLAAGKSLGSIKVNNSVSTILDIEKPVHQHFQINERYNFIYPNVKNFYKIKNNTILVLNNEVSIEAIPKGIAIDVLIIENSPYLNNIESLTKQLQIEKVIITANNKNVNYYLDSFRQQNINSYSIKDEGMYVANLN